MGVATPPARKKTHLPVPNSFSGSLTNSGLRKTQIPIFERVWVSTPIAEGPRGRPRFAAPDAFG